MTIPQKRLWAAGCLVYHGPREQVVPFFESLGFTLPPRKGTADFLQEITSQKDQAVRSGNLPSVWKTHVLRMTWYLCSSRRS